MLDQTAPVHILSSSICTCQASDAWSVDWAKPLWAQQPLQGVGDRVRGAASGLVRQAHTMQQA